MPYDSDEVNETLWQELLSINPSLAKEADEETQKKKTINIDDYKKKKKY